MPLVALFLISFPIACVHQFYFVHTAGFLGTLRHPWTESINEVFGVGGGGLMTIGQMAEIFVLGAMPGGADQTPSANESQDWPALISQLRDRVDRVAGDAQTRQQLAIAYNNYAVSLAEKGRSEDAIDQLEEGLRIDPTNAQLRRNLVMICLKAAQEAYQVHRIAEAKRLVNQAITASPADAEPYVLLGEIEYNAQRLKEAKAAWEKALAIQPNLPEVRTKLDQLNHELPVESNFEKLSQAYFDLRYTSALERGSGFDLQDMLQRLLPLVLKERESQRRTRNEEPATLPVLRPHLTSIKMGAFILDVTPGAAGEAPARITVRGKRIEQFAAMTNFVQSGAVRRFRDVSERCGLTSALKRAGATEHTPVFIGKVDITGQW